MKKFAPVMERDKIWMALKDVRKNLSYDLVEELNKQKPNDRLFQEFVGAVSEVDGSCSLIQVRSDYQIAFYFKRVSGGSVDIFLYHRPIPRMEVEILKTKTFPEDLPQAFYQALAKMRDVLCNNQYARNEMNDAAAHLLSSLSRK